MGLFKSLKKGFKKIGKGFKSAFKSIGKGIKSAMGKIGKFMNKIGIVGQLALMFTPVGAMMSNMFASIGNVAGSMFSKVVGKAATMTTAGASATVTAGSGLLGSTSALARGAGTVLKAAGNFAKAGHAAFKTITEGMTSFIGEFSKTALKKIPGMETMMPKFLGSDVSDNFFGDNSAWSKVSDTVSNNAGKVLASFDEQIGHTDKILTADQANLKTSAEKQVSSAATGATTGTGPMKEGYKFPTDSAAPAPEFGPLKDGYAGASVTDQSLLSNPQMSQVGVEASGAINPITNKPYDVSNTMTTPLTEQVPDSPKGYFSEAFDNAKKKMSQGIEDFKTDPLGTVFGEDPIGKGVDRFSEQVTGNLAQRAVMGTPKAPEITYAHVPEFNMLPVGQYASADINDRAMQIQLSGGQYHMENPYGFGANDYVRKMAIATGGTA
jgi:hypothetical protein